MKRVLLAVFLSTNCIAADTSTLGRFICDVTLSKLVDGENFDVWTIQRAGTIVNKENGFIYNVKGGVSGSTGKMRRIDENGTEADFASKIATTQEEQFFRFNKNGLVFQYNEHPRERKKLIFQMEPFIHSITVCKIF